MIKTWKDALQPDEEKMMANLEAKITVLKHQRYKIQNAASKRISDAKKAKARKAAPVRKKAKPKRSVATATEAEAG